jgi:glycosyltransferase involved in cell wall biosynthesis
LSVTVCVPVWNNITHLDEAIKSVFTQTVAAAEVLVVDDGSERRVDITAGFRLPETRSIRITHRGPQNAWNTGLMNAEGDWFLPLASDDWLESDFLERALARTRAGTDVVVPSVQEHGGPNHRYTPAHVTLDALRAANCYPYCALYRTELLRSLGGWHGQLSIYADWGMWINLMRVKARIALAPGALCHYRNWEGQHSKRITPEEHEAEIARVRAFYG